MKEEKILGKILVFTMFGIYPLAMTNGYFNVTKTKFVIFGTLTLILGLLVILRAYQRMFEKEVTFSVQSIKKKWSNATLTDKFVIGFFIAEIMSFLVSGDKYISFTGCTNKYLGLFAAFLLVFVYYVVKKIDIEPVFFIMLTEFIGTVVCVIALLQFCRVDFFGMLGAIKTDPVQNYLSTLGNTGVFGMYLLLMLPIGIGTYCTTKDKTLKVLSAVSVFCEYIGILISNTDGTFLGFGIIIAAVITVYGKKRDTCIRLVECILLMSASAVVLRFLFNLISHRALSKMAQIAISNPVTIGCLLLSVCILTLIKKGSESEKGYQIFGKIVAVFSIGAALLAVGLLLWFSLAAREVSLGKLEHYLRFSELWGTGRGYIWTRLITIFSEFHLPNKLFGAGQGMVMVEMLENYRYEMVYELGCVYDNAHNVYLHYLFTIGIIGTVMYLGVVLSALSAGWKKKEGTIGKMLAVAVLACLVVDSISILQIITTPILWIYLSLIQKNENM